MNQSYHQRWVDTNSAAQRQRSEYYARHVQKISEIVKCPSRQPLLTVDENLTRHHRSMQISKIVTSNFNENERRTEINRQNQHLLMRLLEIQQGKQQTSFTFKQSHIGNTSQQQQNSDSVRNLRAMALRRQTQAMDVFHENHQIAKRIQNSKSVFNAQQISRDIEEYKRMRSHLRKVSKHNKRNSVTPTERQQLPLLFEHNLNARKRKRKRRIGQENSTLDADLSTVTVDQQGSQLEGVTTLDEQLDNKQKVESSNSFSPTTAHNISQSSPSKERLLQSSKKVSDISNSYGPLKAISCSVTAKNLRATQQMVEIEAKTERLIGRAGRSYTSGVQMRITEGKPTVVSGGKAGTRPVLNRQLGNRSVSGLDAKVVVIVGNSNTNKNNSNSTQMRSMSAMNTIQSQ